VSWILLFFACRTQGTASPPAEHTVLDLPPFEDPSAGAMYQRLAAWADQRGWRATPLRRRGPRLERSWLSGEPGDGAFVAAGAAQVGLSVFASSEGSISHGLQWRAGAADVEGHALQLLMVGGAAGVTPDQMRIELAQGAEAPVEVGAPLTWTVGERVLQTPPPVGFAAAQARLVGYLERGFAAVSEEDLRELSTVVIPVLERGDYQVCDRGPSPGQGIPGPCLPRPPSVEEREAHSAAFAAELARRRAVVGDGARWAALLRAVAPPQVD
jgi:hypothetical protein